MANEFKALKECATVTATLQELAGINAIICEEIPMPGFRSEYDSLLLDIVNTYQVVVDILQPLMMLNQRDSFVSSFEDIAQWYADHYQRALSQPRINAEFTFEKYLQFRKRKEVNTSYPLLKACFGRLHDFIDKWIDNDIWLAMSIDTMLKMVNLVISDLADIRKRDRDEAFMLAQDSIGKLAPYLAMIEAGLAEIASTGTQAEAWSEQKGEQKGEQKTA